MIQVLKKTFTILEFLSNSTNKAKVLSEIVDHTGFNKSTVANILKTLVDEAYVEQEGYKKGYTLGPKLYFLLRHGGHRKDLAVLSYPFLKNLSESINETALLVMLFRAKKYLVQICEANQDIQINTNVFLSNDVYTTATGHVLLAYLPDNERTAFMTLQGLPVQTQWSGSETERGLWDNLKKIRQRGYEKVVINGNIRAFAVPVREEGKVIAALGVPIPFLRYNRTMDNDLIQEMLRTAEEIEQRIATTGNNLIQRIHFEGTTRVSNVSTTVTAG